MKKLNKIAATLLALCLMLCGPCAALAEQGGDVVADLLHYFLGGAGEEPAEEPAAAEEGAEPDDEFEDEDGEYVIDDYGEEDIVVENHIEVTDLAVNESLPRDWMNILLLGTDARGDTKFLRTDTMIVLSINSDTGEAKMTSIMRDIWIDLPEYGGQRLNAACVYGGPEMTMRMINQYFGLNLQSYALVNMKCLVAIVDSLGGIRLDVTGGESRAISRLASEDSKSHDGTGKFAATVPSGKQVLLNGRQVLEYSRIRKSDSDYARTARQRTVLTTIAKRLQQENLLSLASIITEMLQYVETNMTFDQIMNIAAVCMRMDLNNLQEFRVPADDTFEAGMFGNTWCIKPDFEKNAELLHEFIYG